MRACDTPIRVAIADRDFLSRTAVEQVFDSDTGTAVVACCADRLGLAGAIESHEPDAVVTDAALSPAERSDGIDLARDARERYPDLGVVILSQDVAPEAAHGLLERGTARRAWLLKDAVRGANELVDAVRTVVAGGSVIHPRVVAAFAQALREREHSLLAGLTKREVTVLAGIAQGKSNSAIAGRLVVTTRAVEKTINSIYLKLNLRFAGKEISPRVHAALIYLAERSR